MNDVGVAQSTDAAGGYTLAIKLPGVGVPSSIVLSLVHGGGFCRIDQLALILKSTSGRTSSRNLPCVREFIRPSRAIGACSAWMCTAAPRSMRLGLYARTGDQREQEINAAAAEAEGASILTVAGDLLLPIPRRNAMNWPFPGSRSVAFGVNLFGYQTHFFDI